MDLLWFSQLSIARDPIVWSHHNPTKFIYFWEKCLLRVHFIPCFPISSIFYVYFLFPFLAVILLISIFFLFHPKFYHACYCHWFLLGFSEIFHHQKKFSHRNFGVQVAPWLSKALAMAMAMDQLSPDHPMQRLRHGPAEGTQVRAAERLHQRAEAHLAPAQGMGVGMTMKSRDQNTPSPWTFGTKFLSFEFGWSALFFEFWNLDLLELFLELFFSNLALNGLLLAILDRVSMEFWRSSWSCSCWSWLWNDGLSHMGRFLK